MGPRERLSPSRSAGTEVTGRKVTCVGEGAGWFCFYAKKGLHVVKMLRRAKLKTEGRSGVLDGAVSPRRQECGFQEHMHNLPWVRSFVFMNE